MGKLRDEASASKASKPAPGKGGSKGRGRFRVFLATFFSAEPYKAMQGKQARLWTAVGIGALLLLGVWRLFETMEGMDLPGGSEVYLRFGIAGLLTAISAWFSYRVVHYPPFADFLIATQAEMNKVSWISREDLKKATGVVLAMVLLFSLFLFGIDRVWMSLLELIGVLQVQSEGFGSTS